MIEQSLPQYGAFHWIESSQNEAATEQLRRGTPTTGARGYFLRAAAGVDEPLLGASSTEDGIAISRGKGALVFDLLSRTMGPDRFRAALRDLSRDYAHRDLDATAMRSAFEARAARDLGWFFAQWFERPGAPRWELEWKETSGTLRGVVTQAEAPYRSEVEVQIDGPAQRTLRTLALDGPRTSFEWKLGFPVSGVELDPRFRVPHWTPELRAEAEALAPVLRADRLRAAGDLEEAEAMLRAALGEVREPDLIGARFAVEHGLARVLLERNDAAGARVHVEEALRAPTRRADLLPRVYLDLARLAQGSGDSARARWAAQAAITAETVAGQAGGVTQEAKALLAAP